MRLKVFFDELKTIIENNNYIEKSKILFWRIIGRKEIVAV